MRDFRWKDLLFPGFFLVSLALVFFLVPSLWEMFTDPERIVRLVRSWGLYGALGFLGLQVLQVVIFVLPGEVVQVAAGFLFGKWEGFLLSVVGIGLGSCFNFFLARLSGRGFVSSLVGEGELRRFDRFLSSSRGEGALFLLFLIPGIPKDVLCYVAGVGNLPFSLFFLLSMTARLPGIVGSVWLGHALFEQEWLVAGVIGAAAFVLFLLGVLFRDQLHSFLDRVRKRRR
ncbi:TVP38/TMEM64 family protein [Spirochaeta thermophila]|uniref:TVP38/TMEM64 family membrane protein n=1 Tax=Winmispira thermophila (strain ATCC 49972 / DSM 6192 / RI 19.B1) TaxID=665571 RepID=E0RPX8_WINT6|nr:VTT domain-containing protein [Spirochaeta thermophila]ADN02831.1 hypothetical protein STHERM_c18960 [Spirochaeta thermophila DSM 6192]